MPEGARRLAFEALTLVDEHGLLVRDALADLAVRHPLDPRDQALGAEIAQGVLRREDTLDAILSLRLQRPVVQQDPQVMRVLRIGAYQLLFLDRVPASAAVSTSVDLARAVGAEGACGAVNAILRAVAALVRGVQPGDGPDPRRSMPRGDGTSVLLGEDVFPDPRAFLVGHLATRYGVPQWAVQRFAAQHGEAGARRILEASIARPGVSLRPRVGCADDVEAALTAGGFEFEREGPCLVVRGAGDVRALPLWKDGAFAVQDATAAEVVDALAPAAGAVVLDVCAAPGGKSIAFAEAVGPEGRVTAVDVPGTRTQKMADEIARRGVANVQVVAADATRADALPRGPASSGFDVVLVDAPCSNSGVLAKRVEARRRLRDGAALASLVELQTKLLDAAATRVRRGGRLAWSTCSLDDDENGARVRAFLAAHPEFSLASERLTMPVAGRRDGGYVAVMTRAAGSAAGADRG